MLYLLYHDYTRAGIGPTIAEVRIYGPFPDTIAGRDQAKAWAKANLMVDIPNRMGPQYRTYLSYLGSDQEDMEFVQ